MILLIDNYDSFTFNLSDYLQQLHEEVAVYRNDEITINDIHSLNPAAIVISPGPKKPAEAGITRKVIESFYETKPILGICLGFQAIGEFFGAVLKKSDYPMHGKTSWIEHENDALFESISNPFQAMRYHSLFLDKIRTDELEVLARTKDDEVPMAMRHKKYPLYGLQFHPESILTPDGIQILKNWKTIINI